NASALVTYSSVQSLVLNGGSGGVTYNVQGTAAGTALTLNTGPGGDTVHLNNNGKAAGRNGPATVHHAPGVSPVAQGGSGYRANETYGTPASTVTVAGLPTFLLTYAGIGNLNLFAGPGSDHFIIDSTSAVTQVFAGTGGNRFDVCPNSQYLGNLAGPLNLF